MDATPGEGEQAKGGERQEVARALPPMDGRLARYPLSRETSRRCCPCEAPCRAQLMLPAVAIKDAGALYLYKPMNINFL
jgi:hypothetical protein